MIPAAAPARPRALDDAIRAIPIEWFLPSPFVYFVDLLSSAAVGWVVFAAAVLTGGWARAGLLLVATAALYRAVLFIHEIAHLQPRDVPAFKLVWNAIVGVPLLIPSFLYEGVHTDHHRQRCYGTEADPEYLPYGRRRPTAILVSVAASLLAPLVFAVRFGIVAPLAWIVPAVRRLVRERASALIINLRYVRCAPITATGRVQEAAACALVWTTAWLYADRRLPLAVIGCWAAAGAGASLVNAVRTLAAHRYDNDAGELSMIDQLLDSCTIPSRGLVASVVADAGRALVAPVGLRYHALHHWIPSLPYHRLGRAHRRLAEALSPDAPYRSTIAAGLTPVLRDLIRRSRAQS